MAGVIGRPQDGTQLDVEEIGMLETQPDAPPAHEWIRLAVSSPDKRHRLVATQIQRPDRDPVVGTGANHAAVLLELLFLPRNHGMHQVQVLGAKQADARGPHRLGRFRVSDAVHVGQQFQRRSVGRRRRLVAIRRQMVFEVEEFAFEFQVGRSSFVVGVDHHAAFFAVDDNRVACLHVSQDVPNARDGGNPAAPRHNRGVTGLAAPLGDNPRDFHRPEADHLGRQEFIRDNDQRTLDALQHRLPGILQVRVDALDHVANIVQPLLEVFVLNPRKNVPVVFVQSLQRGLR